MRSRIFRLSLMTLLVVIGCKETQQRHFDSVSAVRLEHMIERGWISDFIPEDATDIRVDGDLDSARVYGSYISSDTELLLRHCSTAAESLRVPGHGPKWFSRDVEAAGTAGRLRSKGYEVLHCDDGNFNVVLVPSRRHVSYWSVRG